MASNLEDLTNALMHNRPQGHKIGGKGKAPMPMGGAKKKPKPGRVPFAKAKKKGGY